MLHYHGTPITPKEEMLKMAGKHFCVSFSDTRDADWCLTHGQSVMLDNGAFTAFTQGKKFDFAAFERWVEPYVAQPHWAVIPDIIDGLPSDNMNLVKSWPLRKDCSAPVWHMHEPLGQIDLFLDMGFWRICFGSSGKYWQVGSEIWARRMDETFNWLAKRGPIPWVHMMRGLSLCGDRWPFASADSVNVGRNYKDSKTCPERMARNIDKVQCPINWKRQPEQETMI